MTSTAPAPQPSPSDPQAELRAEDALYYRRVLHGLIDQGADLARAVHEKATGQATADQAGGENRDSDVPAMTLPEAAVAFDRLARAVRRTVALARKLSEPAPARDAGRPERDRMLARRRIQREVEDAIQREAEGADVDVLEAELRERLDGPELDDEIGNRPVADVVADICRDLGLGTLLGNHPWKRRMPGDIEALCERAARPPSGLPDAGQAPVPALPEVGGRFRTWSGPPAYSREASIELMQQILELAPPLRKP